MKQFIYRPEHAGLSAWPSGELRLEGIEVTGDPNAADIFVVPGNIRIFEGINGSGILDHQKLYRLPYLKGNESRHVVFDVSDNFRQPINLPLIFLRCDVRTWMRYYDPNTIQMAWPVEDFSECVGVPEGGFKYDVSFQGWLSSDARIQSSISCNNTPSLKCDTATYGDFTGYQTGPELIRRRAEFRRSMKESRIALCPESIPGVLPYRFFEAMSAGRVPLLVGSDYVLPFASEVNYDSFCVFCPTRLAAQAGSIARTFIHSFPDDEIAAMGKRARQAWVQYLDAKNWPQLHTYAVLKHLGAACPA